jgi:hypothetical protein
MVQAAYAAFRQKWHIRESQYAIDRQPLFFGHAEAEATRVPLKCDLPKMVLDKVELF